MAATPVDSATAPVATATVADDVVVALPDDSSSTPLARTKTLFDTQAEDPEEAKHASYPGHNASFFSLISYHWVVPLLSMGMKRNLDLADLRNLPQALHSRNVSAGLFHVSVAPRRQLHGIHSMGQFAWCVFS